MVVVFVVVLDFLRVPLQSLEMLCGTGAVNLGVPVAVWSLWGGNRGWHGGGLWCLERC